MRLHSVQLLRAVAALVVMVGHVGGATARAGRAEWPALPTGIGVDLFFAISGFIMVYASERLFARPGGGREFLVRRLARIVPLYWLTTTAMLALIALGSRGIAGWPGWSYILSSYLFIPDRTFGSVDGVAFPLLSLGWTLNYEMLFYLVFSAFIALPRRQASACVLATLAIGVVAGWLLQPASDVAFTWTQPIILEFALGLVIGNALLDGRALPRSASLVLIVAACGWIWADPCGLLARHQTPNDLGRLIGWGLPAAAILAAVVLGPGRLPPWCDKPAALLGDASYSLYLTHPFILIVAERVWLQTIGPRQMGALFVIVMVTAVAVAIGVNKLIERPCTRALQRFRSPLPSRPATA